MFNNDVSYLYSDDYLTSSSSNEKYSISNSSEYRPIRTRIYRKRTSTLKTNRRSKHIILSREDAFKYEKYQILARQSREKQKLLEENLQRQIGELEVEQLFLENELKQRQLYIQDLKTQINKNLLSNSNDKEKMSLSLDDFELSHMSITKMFDLNTNIDDNQE